MAGESWDLDLGVSVFSCLSFGDYESAICNLAYIIMPEPTLRSLEEKIVLNDYATTTKTVYNNSFLVVFESLWTVLVVVA